MYNKELRDIVKRLQKARLSLMQEQPFYAVLLLHMEFSLDPMCETAYTDGKRIVFGPEFLGGLSAEELELVMMHEALHAALGHTAKLEDGYDFDLYSTACDIVVNSNIRFSRDAGAEGITLGGYGELMHLTPTGEEGCQYTAEEVYGMLQKEAAEERSKENSEAGARNAAGRLDGGFDDHTYWGPWAQEMALPEEEQEGDIPSAKDDGKPADSGNDGRDDGDGKSDEGKGISPEELADMWQQALLEAAQAAEQVAERFGSKDVGAIPLGAERKIKELTEPQTDWRSVLDLFVQEEITDYSFDPPDRRFQDSPFLLPDFNEKEEMAQDVLFFIDTSGSMSDADITQVFSEVAGAIRQFGGKLKGWLGFFDAEVIEPVEFNDEEELRVIRAAGGGGTSFHCIFRYVQEHLDIIEPASIVILTDGYAPFPKESEAMGIPVLWLITNTKADPPWGKVARVKVGGDRDG